VSLEEPLRRESVETEDEPVLRPWQEAAIRAGIVQADLGRGVDIAPIKAAWEDRLEGQAD